MKYYPFALTATGLGSTDFLEVNASFVRYDEETSGAQAPRLRFKTDNGQDFDLRPGEAVQLSPPCRRLQFANRDALTVLTGTIAIAGPGELIFPSLILSGGVSIVQTTAASPQGVDIASSNNQAFANWLNVVATPAVFSFVEIGNDNGSGKTGYVDQIFVKAAVALDIDIRISNAPTGGGQRFNSKKQGGATTTGLNIIGGTTGGSIGSALWKLTVPAGGKDIWLPTRPVILPPNSRLVGIGQTVNTAFDLGAEVREY